jgi:hypothetical protein
VSAFYSPERAAASQRAHRTAQAQFYPALFQGRPLAFEDCTDTAADLRYAIDVQVAVTLPQLRAPLRFTVQERWRLDLTAMAYRDVTVTEWNLDTDRPSELHKLGAHLFVYGFYDATRDRIVQAAAVNVPRMVRGYALGKLAGATGSRGDQTFKCFALGDLTAIGAVEYLYEGGPSNA